MKIRTKPSLILVYNVDGDLYSRLAAAAHKAFAPKTYSCSLCAITHGHLRMHREWKEFLSLLSVDLEFYHRDEFVARYDVPHHLFPALFSRTGNDLNLLISAEAIEACSTLQELQWLVAKNLDIE